MIYAALTDEELLSVARREIHSHQPDPALWPVLVDRLEEAQDQVNEATQATTEAEEAAGYAAVCLDRALDHLVDLEAELAAEDPDAEARDDALRLAADDIREALEQFQD